MSTQKTPMERAHRWCVENECMPTGFGGQPTDYYLAYLAGDADRERIMKEEASQGFQEERDKLRGSQWFQDREMRDGVDWREDIAKHFYSVARADRAELVACVLEMAENIELAFGQDRFDGKYWVNRPLVLIKNAALIEKLKAEKDAV